MGGRGRGGRRGRGGCCYHRAITIIPFATIIIIVVIVVVVVVVVVVVALAGSSSLSSPLLFMRGTTTGRGGYAGRGRHGYLQIQSTHCYAVLVHVVDTNDHRAL